MILIKYLTLCTLIYTTLIIINSCVIIYRYILTGFLIYYFIISCRRRSSTYNSLVDCEGPPYTVRFVFTIDLMKIVTIDRIKYVVEILLNSIPEFFVSVHGTLHNEAAICLSLVTFFI